MFRKKEQDAAGAPEPHAAAGQKGFKLPFFRRKAAAEAPGAMQRPPAEGPSNETSATLMPASDPEAPNAPVPAKPSTTPGSLSARFRALAFRNDSSAKQPTKRSRKAGAKPFGEQATLMVELENGKILFWELSTAGLRPHDTPPDTAVLSFSPEDWRFHTDVALSAGKAEDLASSEVGDIVRVINRSKDLHCVYARVAERVDAQAFTLYPGQQVLDFLLRRDKRLDQTQVCGLYLKGEQSSIVILYYIDSDQRISKPQITINPDNLDFVLNQFCVSRKISRKETSVVLYENKEFLEALTQPLGAYPDEPTWQGIRVRRIVQTATLASLVFAGLSLAWLGTTYTRLQLAAKDISNLTQANAFLAAGNSKRISDSIPSFARHMTIDQTEILRKAEQLWRPGTRVELKEATLKGARFLVWLPLVTSETFQNRPSVYAQPTTGTVHDFLALEVPEGCTRDDLSLSGAMNEAQLVVYCESPDSGLSRYRND